MSFPVVSHSPLVQSPTLIFACLSGSAGSKPRSSRLFLYFSRFSRLMANRRSFFVIIPILPPTLWDKGFLILTKYQHLFVIPYFSEKLFLCQDKKTAYLSYFCRYYPEFLLFFAAFSHDKQVFGNFYDQNNNQRQANNTNPFCQSQRLGMQNILQYGEIQGAQLQEQSADRS